MESLDKIFKKYGLNLNENQQNMFDLYFSYLIESNEKFNLTAITDKEEVEIKHFLDSVLPEKLIPKNSSVVDVGSGAGFPCLPLKIVRQDLFVCMIDSLNKRVNFLNDVIKLLKLSNAEAVHSRAEDFAKTNREKFDVAVARAVAPLVTLVEYLLPLVKVGGKAIIYKSAKLEEELKVSQKAINVLGGKIAQIENFEIEFKGEKLSRKILVIEKVSHTPAKYPRGQNKPKLSPIK